MAAPCEFELSKCDVLTNFIGFKRATLFQIQDFQPQDPFSYTSFFQNYLLPNIPCLLSSKVTENWLCRKDWVLNGSPNFEVLEKKFGHATVPVANCKQEQYSSHPKQDMTLTQFLEYWQDYRAKEYPAEEPCLYLKDWHFTKAFPDYQAYTTPIYFQSDWLNEFWDTLAGQDESEQDDYRFVYMGPKGTWTPFHADVYRSYSWSANICGRKRWIFFPYGQELQLKDRFGNLVYDVTSPELEEDTIKYPNYCKFNDQRFEIIQEEGQIIFVPSGWHHQVYNLEDTISINHNWLNGCNIDMCWSHLKENLESVKKEIADCKNMEGWHEQCQLILKASAGIDYKMFYDLLKTLSEKRLKTLHDMIERRREEMRKTQSSSVNNDGISAINCLKCKCSLKTDNVDSDRIGKEMEKNENIHLHRQISAGEQNSGSSTKCLSDTGNLSICSVYDTRMRKPDSEPNLETDTKTILDGSSKDHDRTTVIRITKAKGDTTDAENLNENCSEIELGICFGSDKETVHSQAKDLNLQPQQPCDVDHTVFDLYRLEAAIRDMIYDSDFKIIGTTEKIDSSTSLLAKLDSALSSKVQL